MCLSLFLPRTHFILNVPVIRSDAAAVPVKVLHSAESTAFVFCSCLLGNVTDDLPEVERFTSDI
jgi:hypothetical protein